MSYMNYDHKEGQRGVIKRAIQEFMRRSGEFLDPTERFGVVVDADGLGVTIGIRSIRAQQVLQSFLHKEVANACLCNDVVAVANKNPGRGGRASEDAAAKRIVFEVTVPAVPGRTTLTKRFSKSQE